MNVFKHRCAHNRILGPLEHCPDCLAAQRARAIAEAGPRRHRHMSYEVYEKWVMERGADRKDWSVEDAAWKRQGEYAVNAGIEHKLKTAKQVGESDAISGNRWVKVPCYLPRASRSVNDVAKELGGVVLPIGLRAQAELEGRVFAVICEGGVNFPVVKKS